MASDWPRTFFTAKVFLFSIYICSARMRNPPGCVTGCRLHNRTLSCATGHPDVLPESLPILLLNRVDSPTRLSDSLILLVFTMCACLCDSDSRSDCYRLSHFFAVTSSSITRLRAIIASISSQGIPRCMASGSLAL